MTTKARAPLAPALTVATEPVSLCLFIFFVDAKVDSNIMPYQLPRRALLCPVLLILVGLLISGCCKSSEHLWQLNVLRHYIRVCVMFPLTRFADVGVLRVCVCVCVCLPLLFCRICRTCTFLQFFENMLSYTSLKTTPEGLALKSVSSALVIVSNGHLQLEAWRLLKWIRNRLNQ